MQFAGAHSGVDREAYQQAQHRLRLGAAGKDESLLFVADHATIAARPWGWLAVW